MSRHSYNIISHSNFQHNFWCIIFWYTTNAIVTAQQFFFVIIMFSNFEKKKVHRSHGIFGLEKFSCGTVIPLSTDFLVKTKSRFLDLGVCVCVCLCMCTCVCVHTYVYKPVHVRVCVNVCLCMCVYVYMSVCVHVHMCMLVCVCCLTIPDSQFRVQLLSQLSFHQNCSLASLTLQVKIWVLKNSGSTLAIKVERVSRFVMYVEWRWLSKDSGKARETTTKCLGYCPTGPKEECGRRSYYG